MTSIPQDDAFAGGTSRESLSFRSAPVGTTHVGTVLEAAKLVQSRDYDTGKPATWDDGNPKMTAVFAVDFPDIGTEETERSVWAAKPSSLFSAIAGAQRQLGRSMQPGDRISITFASEEVNPDPAKAKRQNPKKIYEVSLSAGKNDAFAGSTPDL